MYKQFHPIKNFFVVFAVLSQIIMGCSAEPTALSINTSNLIELQPTQESSAYMEVISTSLDTIRDKILSTSEAQSVWEQKTDFVSPTSDWGGWVSELKIEPNLGFDSKNYVTNPIKLPYQDEHHLLFLVRNSWKSTHDLRVIFLLNFRQVPIRTLDKVLTYLDFPAMHPQEDRAVELLLNGIPQGFHQISFILIADPNNVSNDRSYRLLQQKSFREERYDLWVGPAGIPPSNITIENASIGQSAASRIGSLELVETKRNDIDNPLISLEAVPNEELHLAIKLFNCGVECRKLSEANKLYDGPVPMLVLIFWDDNLQEASEYNLLANAPDNLMLNLNVGAPSTRGIHTLNIVAVTFPGNSQFSMTQLERIIYPQGIFSQRVVIHTQE